MKNLRPLYYCNIIPEISKMVSESNLDHGKTPNSHPNFLYGGMACKEYLRAISMPCRYQIQILGPLLYVNMGFVTIDKWCQNFNLTAGRPSLEKQPSKKIFCDFISCFQLKLTNTNTLKINRIRDFHVRQGVFCAF